MAGCIEYYYYYLKILEGLYACFHLRIKKFQAGELFAHRDNLFYEAVHLNIAGLKIHTAC